MYLYGTRCDEEKERKGRNKTSFSSLHRNIGTDIVTVELDTPTATEEQLAEIEKAANDAIRNNIPVAPTLYANKDDPELKKV